jgi:hypothetical protein
MKSKGPSEKEHHSEIAGEKKSPIREKGKSALLLDPKGILRGTLRGS